MSDQTGDQGSPAGPLIVVRRQWNDWRQATYLLEDFDAIGSVFAVGVVGDEWLVVQSVIPSRRLASMGKAGSDLSQYWRAEQCPEM